MIADYILIGIALTAILIGYLAMEKTMRKTYEARRKRDDYPHDKKRIH